MNAAADQSNNTSSAVQVKNEPTYPTMEINAKKSQKLDVQVESEGVQLNQLPSSSSNAVSQETERSSLHLQGLNKEQQQHLHFPSAYGNSGGNYNPFSGSTSSSTSSIRPQPFDSHMRQIPHQSISPNQLGGTTQGLIGLTKLDQQNSFNDPKRMPGGFVSPMVNNTASQLTTNSWQPSANKEQNSASFSSVPYVKKEPNDLSTEQQHRHNLSKLHGLHSVNSVQNEQGSSANQGTLKEEFSRGLPASTSMLHTTSSSLLPLNSSSPSVSQLDPSATVS